MENMENQIQENQEAQKSREAQKSQEKAKLGSLENPEIYQNTPGHVIPILEREFDDFDNEAQKFLNGNIEAPVFMGFRLR